MDELLTSTNNSYNNYKQINNLLKKSIKTFKYTSEKNQFYLDFRKFVDQSILKHSVLELSAKDEFHNCKNSNKKFIVVVADTEEKLKLFCLFCTCFNIETYYRKFLKDNRQKVHLSIDHEFNQRQIALMQLCFGSIEMYDYIWILNPLQLIDKMKKIFNRKIMCNRRIYKIMHGSDSLDIPYLFDEYFEKDKKSILKFNSKVIDTRFLCEYYRESLNEEKKCTIYTALSYFKTISNEKLLELETVHDNMGPVQDITWNINKMSSYHLKYALYDVLFLEKFLKDIYSSILKNTPKYVSTYRYVNDITRFVFSERREVSFILQKAKNEIDPLNNFMIKNKNQPVTLINVYTQIMNNFIIPEKDIDINFLLTINYFRTTLGILLKKIVYTLIVQKFQVYKTKSEKYTDKQYLDDVYKELHDNEFYRIIELVNLFSNEVVRRLNTL